MGNEFTPAGSGAAVAPREPRIVDAGRGASWWGEGWRLFTPDVGVWLLIMLILIAIHVCGAFIPVVGLIYTGLAILIMLIVAGMMIAIFGVAILGMLTGAADPSQTGIALGSVVVAVLLGILFFLLLLLPLIMALWFAPALVMLGEFSPGAAMKASFHGCLRNVIPFLMYGAIGLVLAIIATIPFGLGWFVLGPVTIASVYASYCDIFEDKSAP